MELRVGIIVGSVREGRRGEAFARWILGLASDRREVKAELLDLKDWPLPSYSFREGTTAAEQSYPPDSLAGRWAKKITAQDAFIIVTPEYNHGYPGALKNALDHLSAGWRHKPVAFVSYGGFAGGARAVEQLRLVAIELRMVPVRDEVNVKLVGFEADERGRPSDPLYAKRAEAMIDDLLWWARVAKQGRES